MLRTLAFLGALSWMVAFASPAAARLAMEPVREVIRAATPEVRRCVDACLSCHPGEYRVLVIFTIAESGAVTEAEARETDLPEREVAACLVRVVLGLHFPSRTGTGTGQVRINYPFRIVVAEP